MYNAHLEGIHASISSASAAKKDDGSEAKPDIEYIVFGGKEENKVKTRAEEMAFQQKVGFCALFPVDQTSSCPRSYNAFARLDKQQ